MDLGSNRFCTVQLDHQKHKDKLLKNVHSKKVMKASSSFQNIISAPEIALTQSKGDIDNNIVVGGSKRPARMNFAKGKGSVRGRHGNNW